MLAFDAVIFPEIMAGLGIGSIILIMMWVVYDHRRSVAGYLWRQLGRVFVIVPLRYYRPVIRLGTRIYSRICRFVRGWDFWWAAVTGRVSTESTSLSDSTLRAPDTIGAQYAPPYRQPSIIRGKR